MEAFAVNRGYRKGTAVGHSDGGAGSACRRIRGFDHSYRIPLSSDYTHDKTEKQCFLRIMSNFYQIQIDKQAYFPYDEEESNGGTAVF